MEEHIYGVCHSDNPKVHNRRAQVSVFGPRSICARNTLSSKQRAPGSSWRLEVRIAQVAPLYESVPPKLYGGTERVVSYLTEELVRQGHDVTLFASGNSETKARLVAPSPQSLRLDENCIDRMVHHMRLVNMVFEQESRFDILHFHIDYLHYPVSVRQKTPHLTTLHGRLDLPDLLPLYRDFRDIPLVSISDSQREPLAWANWQGTVYHGLPEPLYCLCKKPEGYLAFIGRVSPEKRVDRAIEIAKRTGRRLRIAAKVDVVDEKYFHEEIEPLLNDPGVEFIGKSVRTKKGSSSAPPGRCCFRLIGRSPLGWL